MSSVAEQSWLLDAKSGSVREFFRDLGVFLPDRGTAEVAVSCFANASAHSRDDRNPSCSVNLITGLWNCQGCSASGNAYQAALAVGRSESESRLLARRYGLFINDEQQEQKRPRLPTELRVRKWREALLSQPLFLRRLTELRGWSPEAVGRLQLGWDEERIVFPIRGPRLKIIGIVRYLPGGKPKTLALAGSKRGLFPAPEIWHRRHPVFLVEGEGDAVAIYSAGHRGIAVPGAGSWKPEWAQRLVGRKVIVLMDCDPQGRALAQRVAADVPGCDVVDLDSGRSDHWDVGDLVREATVEGGVWQARRWLGGLL